MPVPSPRQTVWILAIAAGVAALAAFALPYVASTRLVSERIAEEIGDWSGLDVSIGAAPEISVWPALTAKLTNVALSRPDGERLITAENVEIELSALAVLSGNTDFSKARFIRPTIHVKDAEMAAALPHEGRIAEALDAARAIVAENGSAPDTGRLPADDFGVIEFADGRIVSVSGDAETEIATGLNGKIDWKLLNGRGSVEASGVLRGVPFTLGLSSANPLLLFGGGATKVTLNLKSEPANLSFDGTAGLGENPYLEGRATFSTPSIRKLAGGQDIGGPDGPATGAISMDGRVMGDRARIRLEDAAITLDGNAAHGALELLLSGKLPKVSGTLAFDTLDLGAFLSAFTPLDTSAGTGPGVIDADFASRLNLDLRLSAAKASAGSFGLANVAATARVDEEVAAFDISDAAAFGGDLQASLRFDRRNAGGQVEARLLASDVDGSAFGAAAGMTTPMPTGRGTVSVILKGAGESWDALLAHASGSFSASFGPGTLSGIDLDSLVARARQGSPFTLEEVAGDSSPIDGLEVKATVADGAANIDKAQIRSPLHRIVLSGAAFLAGGGLKLFATAEPPQQAATGATEPPIATTFSIDGSWSAATVTPTRGPGAE
jgi:AsmA protein